MKSGSHSLIVPENLVRLLPSGKTGDGAIEAFWARTNPVIVIAVDRM